MPENHQQLPSGLQALDYLAIVAYLVITLLIVYRASRRQADTEDFFLGGRSMPWFAVGLSILATLLSTNTYLGAPGEMIKYGPAYFLGYLAVPFVIAIVVGLWIPFFMRLRVISAYEYLELRFDRRARLFGGLLFLGLRLGWMSMVVYTASMAIVTMLPGPLYRVSDFCGTPHPVYPVIAAVGAVATIYACLGGIRAVIWTDVLQAVMLFGGVAVIIAYVAWSQQTGVVAWWEAVVAQSDHPPRVKWVSTDISERTTVLWAMCSIFAWNVCTHCADQVALQRYFTTKSLSAARKSFVINILGSLSIAGLLAISGLALRYFYLAHADRLPPGLTPASGADQLMPFFFAYQLPAGLGGLILVSFLCDAMQTLGSGVNSIAAVISTDVAARERGLSAAGEVRAARRTTLAVGLVATVLAVLAAGFAMHSGKTIFDMLPRMFNMFLGPLAAMFLLGMFFPRATGNVVFATALLTQLFSSLWSWWGEVPALLAALGLDSLAAFWKSLLGVDAAGHLKTPSVLLAIAVPALFGLGTGWLLSSLFGRVHHAGTEFCWRAVVRRGSETTAVSS
jgi:SSS family solute:Na+ symporter